MKNPSRYVGKGWADQHKIPQPLSITCTLTKPNLRLNVIYGLHGIYGGVVSDCTRLDR